MIKIAKLLLAAMLVVPAMVSAKNKVVVVMVDGYRWQELFRGADSMLVNTKEFGNPDMMKADFWRPTADERRSALMPFTWSHIAKNGVMIGNRDKGCRMSVTNNMWFSYPGYNETLCGYPDDKNINSNAPVDNPNMTVFEVANNTPEYRGKVLVFGSWGRFIQIFNEKRSGLEVNANYRHSLAKQPTERELYVDKMQDGTPRYWEEERFDVFTHEYAVEAMKSRHPELLFVGYGDTDEWAHAGNYRLYLEAANDADRFIRELWETAQADPFYKDQTTFNNNLRPRPRGERRQGMVPPQPRGRPLKRDMAHGFRGRCAGQGRAHLGRVSQQSGGRNGGLAARHQLCAAARGCRQGHNLLIRLYWLVPQPEGLRLRLRPDHGREHFAFVSPPVAISDFHAMSRLCEERDMAFLYRGATLWPASAAMPRRLRCRARSNGRRRVLQPPGIQHVV